MKKRNHDAPNPFQWDGFETAERPASAEAAASAVQRFVATFVVSAKRERMQGMLLHKERSRRNESIRTVYKWIEPTLRIELAGNKGFPQSLKERFGDLAGIVIDETHARHVTIAAAAIFSAAGGCGAIFIADSVPIALLFPEVGPPTLCSAR